MLWIIVVHSKYTGMLYGLFEGRDKVFSQKNALLSEGDGENSIRVRVLTDSLSSFHKCRNTARLLLSIEMDHCNTQEYICSAW